jgi:FlaA1/EpsC-like NDP-sugar epimerase
MLVDAGLLAAAYLLSFDLRFDSGTPLRYQHLFEKTLPWVVAGTLVILALNGVYRRETRFTGRRDYEALVRGVLIASVVTMGAVVLLHPVEVTAANGTHAAVGMPAGVMALFLLLALFFLMAARVLVHVLFERRLRGVRGGRGYRDVLIIGGGDGGRLVVITFHSLEYTKVKEILNHQYDEMRHQERAFAMKKIHHPLFPTDKEKKINPRSRSARLHVYEKVSQHRPTQK